MPGPLRNRSSPPGSVPSPRNDFTGMKLDMSEHEKGSQAISHSTTHSERYYASTIRPQYLQSTIPSPPSPMPGTSDRVLPIHAPFNPPISPILSKHQDAPPPQYARKDLLSRFIPEADPEHKRARTCKVRMSKRMSMMTVQSGLAVLILLTVIAFTVSAIQLWNPDNGIGTIFLRECATVRRANTALHVMLNVLSTLLLGAGHYCMQVSLAPTSSQVREAHAHGKSYDIGIQSLRNLRRISNGKKTIWVGLGLCSVLLHFFWNSAFFTSVPYVSFPIAAVTQDFLAQTDNWDHGWFAMHEFVDTPGPSVHVLPEVKRLHTSATGFTRYSNAECVGMYLDPNQASGDLVLVTRKTMASNNNSSLVFAWISKTDPFEFADWICQQDAQAGSTGSCTTTRAYSHTSDWVVSSIEDDSDTAIVDHCLVGERASDMHERCGLHYNGAVMVIVCILCGLECILIIIAALICRRPSLTIVGDAIAESLKHQIRASTRFTDAKTHERKTDLYPQELNLITWPRNSYPRRWCVLSWQGWSISIILFLATAIAGFASFGVTYSTLRSQRTPPGLPAIWNDGKIKTDYSALATDNVGSNGPSTELFNLGGDKMSRILLINVFQLIVSLLYGFYNYIFTRQALASEVFRFIAEKKALRVSSPQNAMQRSSYLLTLPWSHAAPQLIMFSLLHWLISQSVFPIWTTTWTSGPSGTREPGSDLLRVGISSYHILAFSALWLISLVILAFHSLQRYPNVPDWFPQMATDSAFLAACCHRPEEDQDCYLYPLRLGIVREETATDQVCHGRFTFSSDTTMTQPLGDQVYGSGISPPARSIDGASQPKANKRSSLPHERSEEATVMLSNARARSPLEDS